MLKDRGSPTDLRASNQLPARDRHLIRPWILEANWIRIPVGPPNRICGRQPLDAEAGQGVGQRRAQASIAIQDPTCEAGIRRRTDDRVRNLVGVEDGAPAGRPANQVPTSGAQTLQVDVFRILGVSK
jgi:hypothetical protein